MPAPPQPQVIRPEYPSGIVFMFVSVIILIGGIATLLDSGNVIWHNQYKMAIGEVLTFLGFILLLTLIYRIKKLGARVALGD